MTSYLFAPPAKAIAHDDPHLEISVAPSASAFYAGESFSVVISFRNTREPVSYAQQSAEDVGGNGLHAEGPNGDELPGRLRKIGRKVNAEAGPSRPTPLKLASPALLGSPYSPGANPLYRAPGWPKHDESPIRSPDGWDPGSAGHVRRARSMALGKGGMSPQELVWALAEPPPLPKRPVAGGIPKSHPHSRKISTTTLPSPPSTSVSPSPQLSPIEEHSSSETPGTNAHRPSRPGRTPPPHARTPSYQNAYGASFLGVQPPPRHPSQHPLKPPEDLGVTTVLWAHTRLVAHFSPSNTYIPPDPLLPLRSLLLHQPVGSGTLTPRGLEPPSRWQMSFGTGSIGQAKQPSLTGSLFGLAKSVVYGGVGGSLEEERKRVWNMKDLPVLETSRSLLGVDIKLKEGESKDFVYTLQLPEALPPAFKGKAFRFSYDLIISLNVNLPGRRQRTKEVSVPIRVWANVSLRTYDVLHPIIQSQDEGRVTEPVPKRRSSVDRNNPTLESLQNYAKHLLSNIQSKPNEPKPSQNGGMSKSISLRSLRPRKADFISGDDELVEEGQEGCGEAVEILSRHSPKTSYDISKDGSVVAVLTLIKTTYRLGETVLGVVTFNSTSRRVSKFSAYLETTEIIPENLLPPSASTSGPSKQPPLSRLHAEHRSTYCHQTSQQSFSLDIPSDGTPAFSLAAGPGKNGGLEWKLKLSFLVAVGHGPGRKGHIRLRSSSTSSVDSIRSHRSDGSGTSNRSDTTLTGRKRVQKVGVNLIPSSTIPDGDNDLYTASKTLSPLIPITKPQSVKSVYEEMEKRPIIHQKDSNESVTSNDSGHSNGNSNSNSNSESEGGGGEGVGKSRRKQKQIGWLQMKVETVECEIPIKVLSGNTAFLVRPLVYTV